MCVSVCGRIIIVSIKTTLETLLYSGNKGWNITLNITALECNETSCFSLYSCRSMQPINAKSTKGEEKDTQTLNPSISSRNWEVITRIVVRVIIGPGKGRHWAGSG